jgi:hypothetical protein
MTAKKQRNRIARQLRHIGLPWADAHKLAKRFTFKQDVHDCVSIPFRTIITGTCPSDGGDIGFFQFPKGRIHFNCAGVTKVETTV